jgi:serine/threonine protein kinase
MLPSLPPRFTYKELQSVTQNFKEKLGAGGFGSVYAGTLPDKSQVAVKQLEGAYTGEGKKQFQAEVATIGSINHVNLVKLRGFCMEAQHRLLVYEYMASSSLDRSLFRSDHHDLNDQPTSQPEVLLLDWSTRYSIALGVARGLAYLHEGCSRQIIHCDIKPENILLDEHMMAKLSDFGLSKVLQKDRSNKISNMRGTRGYLAREWLLLNAPITPKSDVYSFGMVLLELCTGRRNLNSADVENLQETEECYVPAKALSLRGNTEKLLELIDAQLGQEFDKQQAVKLIEISLACIQDDPASRPTMGTVVKLLEASITTSSI